MVDAVVMGSLPRAASPDIQDVVTRTALKMSLRWSCQAPALRQGLRNNDDIAVAASSTKRTPFRLSACFLATSYMPRSNAEPNVIQIHIVAAKLGNL